ncbi:PREDICTED: uncharacterized protein LOC106815856 [Priapulus caudatus]|uniref:Uncharacterized protein LOC106815856 n=1 Tax=Priapulus caudatus TaxID=37621 RepID=A0ABM1EUJ6_PRICU|nr:PREDICTED: uncharacterized protein LOC106815856 [Priapulus caudatus]
MDGPNVNLKFHREMVSHIEQNYDKRLLDIGSCGLHQIHGALKNAMEKNEVFKGLQDFFTSLFYLFHDAPARQSEYTSVTGTSKFGLQFCKHRWVENLPVAKRALEILPDVIEYVKAVQKKDKRVTKPTCKSYTVVENATTDPMTVPMLQVYISICRELQPILVKYQCDKPMIPFLGADIFNMLRSLIQRFGKPDNVKAVTTQRKMLNFDAKKSRCDVKKVDVGAACKESLRLLLNEKKVSELKVFQLRTETQNVMSFMVAYMLEKLPLKHSLVRNASCLAPSEMVHNRDECIARMSYMLQVLAEKKQISYDDCDVVKSQYVSFLDVQVARYSSSFAEFRPEADESRVETFLYKHLHQKTEYSKLWQAMKIVLLLSHGQASVERGFSVNKQVAADNLQEETFVARRLICEHVNRAGGVCNVQITPQLLVAAAGARQKYLMHLDEEKRKKERVEKSRGKKRLEEEIEEVKSKRRRLNDDIDSMQKSADALSEKAERTGKLTLVSQSNSLRRTVVTKKVELVEVVDKLDMLLLKLKDT